MVGSPLPFAALALGSSGIPVPISAIINGGLTQLVVTFDRQLQVNPTLTPSNYVIRWNDQFRTVTTGAAAGFTATFNIIPGAADAGIDKIDYDPPPFELTDLLTAIDVLAFTDFPVTM